MPGTLAGKFDGSYSFKIKPDGESSVCGAPPSRVTVKDNKISGFIVILGSNSQIKGEIDDDGNFNGKILGGVARFKGGYKNGVWSGTWKGRFGCRGTLEIF